MNVQKQYDGSKNYNKAKKALSFLINEFGFSIIKEKDYLQEHECGESLYKVISYNNSQIDIELAICLDSDIIHFDIRKILNGLPVNYHDEIYCVSKEELFKLTNDSRMDNYSLKYYEKLDLLIELLKKSLSLFSNGNWLAPELIKNKVEELNNRSWLKYYIDEIFPIMQKSNFERVHLNSPSYMVDYEDRNILKFSNGEKNITIKYHFDYREQYHEIYVFVNGRYFKGESKGDFHQFLRNTLQKAIEG